MADTVSVAGKRVNKWYVYGGVAGAGLIGIMWWRNKQSSSASSSSATDPVTGLPYSEDNQVDPVTGLTYLAEAQQYGSVAAAEAAVGAGYGGVSGTGTGYSGLGYGYNTGSPGGGNTGTGGTGYTTNAQWAQAVEAGLTALGYNAMDVGAAIGRYLASLPLSADQVTIVQTAVAEYGPPPVGQFSIISQPGSPGGNTVSVPAVEGLSEAAGESKITAAGLVVGNVSGGGGNIQSQTPGAGAQVASGSKVDLDTAAPGGGGGGQTVTVPKVTGMPIISQALPALQRAGLKGKISGSGFNPAQENIAYSQTPGAGTKVAAGTTVDLGDIGH